MAHSPDQPPENVRTRPFIGSSPPGLPISLREIYGRPVPIIAITVTLLWCAFMVYRIIAG